VLYSKGKILDWHGTARADQCSALAGRSPANVDYFLE
jgi:hypothetical protein